MARPRKSPHLKNQPITISLPPNMISSLDELLSYGANRSLWIQSAIKIRMVEPKENPDNLIKHMEKYGDGTDFVMTPKNYAYAVLAAIKADDHDIPASVLKELKELI